MVAHGYLVCCWLWSVSSSTKSVNVFMFVWSIVKQRKLIRLEVHLIYALLVSNLTGGDVKVTEVLKATCNENVKMSFAVGDGTA